MNINNPFKKSLKGKNCFFHAAVIVLLNPHLKLIRGQYSRQHKNDTCHFWLEDEDNNILDLTASKGGEYSDGEQISAKKNIDWVVNDPLFKELDEEVKRKIISIANA